MLDGQSILFATGKGQGRVGVVLPFRTPRPSPQGPVKSALIAIIPLLLVTTGKCVSTVGILGEVWLLYTLLGHHNPYTYLCALIRWLPQGRLYDTYFPGSFHDSGYHTLMKISRYNYKMTHLCVYLFLCMYVVLRRSHAGRWSMQIARGWCRRGSGT